MNLHDTILPTLIAIAVGGAIWSGYKMSSHSRDIHVYKQVKTEMPLGVWPLVPRPLEPKTLPRWMIKLAAYFLPTPKKG